GAGWRDGCAGWCLHWRAVQEGARGDVESRVGGPALFEQVGDVGLDAFEGLFGKGAAFDREYAASGDGGLFRAAGDQGGVQVAGAEEGARPAAERLAEEGEGGEGVGGGEGGGGAGVGAGSVGGGAADGGLGPGEP